MDTFLWFLAAVIAVYSVFHLVITFWVALDPHIRNATTAVAVRVVVFVALAFLAYWVAPL